MATGNELVPLKFLSTLHLTIQRSTKDTDQCPVNKDHSNLVKYSKNEDALGPILHFMQPLYEMLKSRDLSGIRDDEIAVMTNSHQDSTLLHGIQGFQQLSPASENTTALVQKQQMLKSILGSINTEETEYRYRLVESAYQSTFNCMFEPAEVGLLSWIQTGQGIFWISGKPGSGKSTAMKKVYQNYLKSYENSPLSHSDFKDVTAKFFFFQRGSSIQKSFEGLLRSVLYQILSSTEVLAELLLPQWQKMNSKNRKTWSPFQLDSAWEQILEQRTIKLRITLFLDALDEFEGPADKVAHFVEKAANQPFTSMTHVRICFASRPWDVFNDRFGKCPGFRMEQFTQPDIERYVYGSIKNHDAMKILWDSPDANERASVRRTVLRVIKLAQGVFIWVKIVLENLLDARAAGAELEELDNIINSLPHELEDLYGTLLARVKEAEYRSEAYAMLEVLVRAPRPLKLHEFRCIVKCATMGSLEDCVNALKGLRPQMSPGNLDTLRRRVKSRCGGLIEIVTEGPYSNAGTVQLMHQTVKDFVSRPGFKEILDVRKDPRTFENGHSFLAKFGLAMIRGAQTSQGTYSSNQIPWLSPALREKLFALCADAFHYAERTTGFSQSRLLDSIDDHQYTIFFPQERYDNDIDSMMDYSPRRWPIDSRLSFVTVVGLPIYLKTILVSSNQIGSGQGVPILHALMECLHFRCIIDRTEMARFLLERGADVHQVYDGLTPFQALFRCVEPLDELYQYDDDFMSISWIKTEAVGHMAELLLEYGSDPDSDIFYLKDNIELFCEESALYTSKPLHVSIECPAIVQLLLDYGANVNGLNGKGQTPLDLIVSLVVYEYGEYDTIEYLRSAEILLQNGGRITQQSLQMIVKHNMSNEEDEGEDSDDESEELSPSSEMTKWERFLEELRPTSDAQLSLHEPPVLSISLGSTRSMIQCPRLLLPERRHRSFDD